MISLVLFIAATMAGCIESAAVPCGDGVCAPGTTCEPTTGRCLSDVQRAACDGLAEGASCSIAGALGVCSGGACATFSCGDGMREGTERCDGTDLGGATCATLGYYEETSGLACTADCLFDVTGCARTCGDGVADAEEQCDGADVGGADCTSLGFYQPGSLTCTPACRWDAAQCVERCGDGVVNGPELCDGAPPAEACVDFGFDAGPASCSASCGVSYDHCARLSWRRTLANTGGLSTLHASDDDVWIAGAGGYIARQVGGAWVQTPTPVAEDIVALWAEGTRAWAVSLDRRLLVWSGATWQVEGAPVSLGDPSDLLIDVWATGSTAFVLARKGGVFTWDGAAWQRVGALACGFASSIAGTSPTDLWVGCVESVTGDGPGLYHWDGSAWTLARPSATYSVAARGDTVARCSHAGSPTIYENFEVREQGAWRTFTLAGQCASLVVRAPNQIWGASGVGAFYFDGTRPARLPLFILNEASVVGATRVQDGVLAATVDGGVVRAGAAMMLEISRVGGKQGRQLWSDVRDRVFVVTQNGHVIDQRATAASGGDVPLTTQNLGAIWGTSSDDLWVGGGQDALLHFDGAAWTEVSESTGVVTALFGAGASDVWLFGSNVPYHYDGATWAPRGIFPPGAASTLTAGAALDADDALVATDSPPVLHRWRDGAWSIAATLPAPATGISVVGPQLAFIATGTQLHWFDGLALHDLDAPIGNVLPIRQVFAFAADDVFVASQREILHFDGARWSPVRLELDAQEDIISLGGRRGRVEILSSTINAFRIRSLLRIAPWVCRASELDCGDQIDDDCDGAIDSDC